MAKVIKNASGQVVTDNGNALSLVPTYPMQSKSVTPTTAQQVIEPDSGYDALSQVTVGGVTSAIDSNIQAENIRKDVSILGVTGTFRGGGVEPGPNQTVLFIDYDGSIVDAYTPFEFAQLSAMPANPTHEGLTAQGWNWTLSDAKTYVATYKYLVIGQNYATTDGKTRVYISLAEGRTSPVLGLRVNGSVDVDWGDGTTHDTLEGTSLSTMVFTQPHDYASAGDYVIKLTVTGSAVIYGYGSSYLFLAVSSTSDDNRNRAYRAAVTKIELGNDMGFSGQAFGGLSFLIGVTIPTDITTIGAFGSSSVSGFVIPAGVITSVSNSMCSSCTSLVRPSFPRGITSFGTTIFNYCNTLARVSIPDTVTSIGNGSFSNCPLLKSIVLPADITQINYSLFYSCQTLASIEIPSGVTLIDSNSFTGCNALARVVLRPTTPPTLNDSAAFPSSVSDLVFYVPYSADHSILNAYKAATNWSAFESQMVELDANGNIPS